MLTTTDLSDEHDAAAQIPNVTFRDFGRRASFQGQAVTVKCFEDNSRIKELLATGGHSKVLVVDGGASTRCALLGDMIATDAVKNGWEAIVVYGCVRDSAVLATLDIAIKALGTHPRRSTRRGEGVTGLTLNIAGAAIAQGDLIVGDQDGVLALPSTLAS